MARGAFYIHLADAIEINKHRRRVYAAMTRGGSRGLSTLLIWFERLSLPFALYLDRRARPFQARGIPIVEDDFVPMDRILPVGTPPRYTGRSSPEDFATVRRALKRLVARIRGTLRKGEFAGAADAALEALDTIEALERDTRTHHCMSRHFVESIGLCAANSIRYAEQSSGDTVGLSRRLLKTQVMGLFATVPFDRMAQRMHALGAGILVNDVPDIPFRATWSMPPRRPGHTG